MACIYFKIIIDRNEKNPFTIKTNYKILSNKCNKKCTVLLEKGLKNISEELLKNMLLSAKIQNTHQCKI